MIRLYFKLAAKALIKNRYYTFINIFGLVCGMLSALVIAKYIGGSMQFDTFHVNKNRIYSVTQEESVNGNPQPISLATYGGIGELLRQYPEVMSVTRESYYVGSLIIRNNDDGTSSSYFENSISSADSSFLNTFTFPFIYGNPATALSQPNSIVLTQAASRKYFGNANPIGQSLTIRLPWGTENTYSVTGVMQDIPRRSRFRFHFLVSKSLLQPDDFWDFAKFTTYILLKENANTEELANKLTTTLRGVPELTSTHRKVIMSLTSLADVHLSATEYVLAAIGIFIVLISWVNYINQVIAQSYWRLKEVGILRIMGATPVNLKMQFAVESALICVTSAIIVAGIYAGIEPALQSFTNGHLLPLIADPTPVNLAFIVIFLIGIAMATAIPALIVFSQDFGTALRNAYRSKIGSVRARRALVVVQFSISTILVIGILVISKQLTYMRTHDKGVNMENVLVVKAPIIRDTTWNVKRKTLELFKSKCAELPFVRAISSSTIVPGEEYRNEVYISFQEKDDKFAVHQNLVDEHFLDLYDVAFLAGHNFMPDALWKNNSSIIVNESAARSLGIYDFDKAINSKIVDHESGKTYDLIGIVTDFHQTSLKYKMEPMAFRFQNFRGHVSLKIDRAGGDATALNEKLGAIRQIWDEVYPDTAFDTFFLDEQFAAQDAQDRSFGKLFECFTALSIVISCLGLFGLSLLMSTKRQREIGVRKVFGASSGDILAVLLKGYAAPLAVSVAIGAPLACLLMNKWLSNFAYRIAIGFGTLSLAVLSLALIFLFTVSYHTIRASGADPVKILKD